MNGVTRDAGGASRIAHGGLRRWPPTQFNATRTSEFLQGKPQHDPWVCFICKGIHPRLLISAQYWQVSEASLAGTRISAVLSGTGIDWMQMNEDGFRRPHVRAQFVTGDGAVILMRYTGLVEQTAAFSKISPRTGTINTCVFQSNLPRMT